MRIAFRCLTAQLRSVLLVTFLHIADLLKIILSINHRGAVNLFESLNTNNAYRRNR